MSERFVLFLLSLQIFILLFFCFRYVPTPRETVPEKNENRGRGKLGITGGVSVEDDAEFPFQLKMFRDGRFICGAAIIGNNLGITAAHCVYQFEDPAAFEVVAGSRSYTIQTKRGKIATQNHDHEQRRRLTTIKIHPKYRPTHQNNDIALFHVDTSFYFDKWVNKIRLPPTPGVLSSALTDFYVPKNITGLVVMATGWGTTIYNSSANPDVLQKVEMPIVDCQKYFNEERDGLDDSMICAGQPPSGRDTCQGDSGGPLFFPSADPLLVGLTSWGYGCGGETPGVYTNVRLFTPWIQESMSRITPNKNEKVVPWPATRGRHNPRD